jgi:hypothetical protein
LGAKSKDRRNAVFGEDAPLISLTPRFNAGKKRPRGFLNCFNSFPLGASYLLLCVAASNKGIE